MNETAEGDAIAALVNDGWQRHGDEPEAVAQSLEGALGAVQRPGQAAPFAALVTHLYAEHLPQRAAGIALLERLRGQAAAADALPAIARHLAVLRGLDGDGSALDALPAGERMAALGAMAAALAARGDTPSALARFDDALALAEAGLPDGAPALRALAIAGNNLACTLEEKAGRSAAETAGMVRAAQAALQYWRRAGGWLEEERAEYRLAMSLRLAGDAAGAAAAARRCIALCEQHEALPFERFFGATALAMACREAGDTAGFAAARDAAARWRDAVPAEERAWCDADWNALQTPL